MRTFIAIDIPEASQINNLLSELSGNQLHDIQIKLVDPKQLHITLAFLGEITAEQADFFINVLNDVDVKKLELELVGLEVFKSIRQPQVLWVGIKPDKILEELWNNVNNAISGSIEKREKNPYSPHLTIGRIKNFKPTHNLGSFIKKYDSISFGKVSIEEFILYRSKLTPSGPVYTPIKTFRQHK